MKEKNKNLTAIGDKIKQIRETLGCKPKELANEINTTGTTITNWETNVSEPNASQIFIIAETFRISFDWLLGSNGNTPFKINIGNDNTTLTFNNDKVCNGVLKYFLDLGYKTEVIKTIENKYALTIKKAESI